MDELFYDAIDFLKCLISTPSTSRDESRAADVVERFIKAAGFAPMRHGCNVWCSATTFNPSLPTIWLNSHIDTVKPAAGWTLDPFTPTEADDRLYGLGSNDAGASVVSLFAAFRHLAETGQPYNLIFLASCEEEVSGRGGIESMIQMLPKADLVVVGEPTGMQP
ncbi:MAG: M20/M25/M40 family metallo-hydrolase, partial [Muribaculaceae bacterium]|nr:M20/M25/M40 family metallo-hydrolase [Muribaculaceae bacterium]